MTPPDRPAPLPDPSSSPVKSPLHVLLLVADAARLRQLRGLLLARWPDCRIEEDSDPVDALLKAVRMPADLMLVDAALSVGPPAVLVRHLGRVAPAVTMLVFDEHPAPADGPLVAPWSELQARLARWSLDLHRRSQRH